MSGMPYRRDAGFTLLELISVMLIVAILAAIGIPSFKYVTTSNRISSEVNALLGDLQYARTESVKEGLPVSVCPSSNGTGCVTTTPSAWEIGWIVFVDTNGSGTVDAGDAVLRIQPSFTGKDTFTASNNVAKTITFNRLGYGTTGATVTTLLMLHDTTSNSSWTRCLAITTVGMLTTLKSGVGGCS